MTKNNDNDDDDDADEDDDDYDDNKDIDEDNPLVAAIESGVSNIVGKLWVLT